MRSVPAGSFDRLSSVVALWLAWRTYRVGKRRGRAVATFALDADEHVFGLHRELRRGDYRPGRFTLRHIRDPKLRLIAAPPVRDRLIHQAVVSELAPHYERSFIHHSFAGGQGRGPHRAVLAFLGWSRRRRYRLRLDIRHYFQSVHHPTLLEVLSRRLRDARTRALLAQLLSAGGAVYRSALAASVREPGEPATPEDRGLAVGSCLSQWCGNVYLDGLDHFVKRHLRVGAYLRYMDDFVLLSDDRDRLVEARHAIERWLHIERRLSLNPKHWRVVPTREPCTFLGYRVSPAGLCPGRTMRRRLRRKVRAAAAKGPAAVEQCVASYRSIMLFG